LNPRRRLATAGRAGDDENAIRPLNHFGDKVVNIFRKTERLDFQVHRAAIQHAQRVGVTTLADFADRSLGIGYAGGTAILLALLGASLFVWYRTLGSVAVDTVSSPKSEMFYWVTIMFSQTLGTALGDWTADTAGIGYGGGVVTFGVLLAIIAAAYFWTKLSRTALFWAAFILTRPLGAVVGDLLDKPVSDGGFALSRYTASAVLLGLIAFFVFVFSHKPARRAH
jgi:uncharacterized membrane-anchored protein